MGLALSHRPTLPRGHTLCSSTPCRPGSPKILLKLTRSEAALKSQLQGMHRAWPQANLPTLAWA